MTIPAYVQASTAASGVPITVQNGGLLGDLARVVA